MLKQRLLTALVLAPVTLAGVFLLPLAGFELFVAVAMVLGAWEWSQLAGFERLSARLWFSAGLGALLGLCIVVKFWVPVQALMLLSVLFWLLALYWVVRYPRVGFWRTRGSRLGIGYLVLVSSWFALVELKRLDQGGVLILLLLLLVWASDIGAYISGKTWGRNKLAPHVSPGKTREGLWGGLFCCLLVGAVYGVSRELPLVQLVYLVVLSLCTGLASVLGDLFESLLKRHQGIKDSGCMLPGHGGVLDRIDSLTAAAPVFVLGLWLIA
ncbi:phosphatidate cytidylyltransferase [Marinobacterium rhizophilum]|uniref:Phosphatidate cytidylyltransferase n=1 Tax=Marinobacterium rhizophilum TaxID=420402 RepID=A0ABY5HH52_9GAMM|nr:phosphatidate cytidylyltransferase [Marinobacterium rhizophilum]UTW10296.1 phosphatidate cytidylyltransferase [Marinobacterium rhizophilum]